MAGQALTPYHEDERVKLYHGDCIEVMRALPSESVDAVITSPPYAMQRKDTYGGIPEGEYPAWTVAWMAEARRAMKPSGSVIINITPHAAGGQLSDYVLRTRLALRDAGWWELDEMVWHKPTGLPTGNRRRPRRMWESLLWYGPTRTPYSNPTATGNQKPRPTSMDGIKRSKERGWKQYGGTTATTPRAARAPNVVSIQPDNTQDAHHPAKYPWKLAEWCGKLICPPGGTVLDPFSGSASTGIACIRNGWDYIGIDAAQEYVDMSRKRLAAEQAKAPPALDLDGIA